MPLKDVLTYITRLGYEAVELAAWNHSNHLNIDKILKGGASRFKKDIKKRGLIISGLSNHFESQLVLGPHDRSTDEWYHGTPEEKIRYGMKRIKLTAEAASALDVSIVTGFVGSHNWGSWYIFPRTNEEIFEEGFHLLSERWGDILDFFADHGVKFAHEVHPQEQAYNIETAERAIKALHGRKEFGFNFDPSHLVWQGIDPVVFIKRLGERIYHCHAKDGEVQQDEVNRSGILSTGSWRRLDRGFRFRVPGWGDIKWTRIISALVEVGYDYVLSFEHEDPVMSKEDGCEKCIQFLKPLIIKTPLEKI
jgi:sugar phosphate isomerase/epimerase